MADKMPAGSRMKASRPGWTRRAALGAMASLCALRGVPAQARADDGLREICRNAVRAPAALGLGAEAAGGRDAAAVEAALRLRLAHEPDRMPWADALRQAGRRDLAAGDTLVLGGMHLTRTEAEMLALGARLAAAAPAA